MRSKAPLMLMEQIVMLLVFALAAALCVQAFVKSDDLSARSQARDRAVTEVQRAAETLRYYAGDYTQAAQELGYAVEETGFAARFDENWALLEEETAQAAYVLTARAETADVPGLGRSEIRLQAAGADSPLFSVQVAWQEVDAYG